MASDGYRNFRLRGIPDNFQNRKEVRELVRAALQLDKGAEIAVHSLARNPLERCSRIATLTFDNHLPKALEGPQTEWMFTVPDSDEDEAEKWGPQRLVFDTHFRGFTPFHRADDSECSNDLIAIAGLGGHAFGSFKARGSSFMWLRDDLPIRLRQTRIMVYGYDAKVVPSSSFQNLNDLGNMFRYSVKRLQLGSSAHCQIRPTIFLGHSLGGLIVKEAIMKMKGSKKAEDAEFLDNIIAFMFFGVPHQGMVTEHLFPMVGEQPNRSLIQSLGKHSAILQRYEEEFSTALDTRERRPEILSFYETEMSPTAKFNEGKDIWEYDETKLAVLVDRSSAINGCTSGYAIARNHSDMVKFTSEMDEMYDIVVASLLPLLSTDRITLKPLSVNERDCLQSLFFNEQHFRQAEIHNAENTCAWILKDPRYRHWKRQPRGLLWIKGKPGAGKSVVMKYVSENLREESSGSRELVASFYIHGRGVDLQKRITGVYRALLHELLPNFDDFLSQATVSFDERESRYGSYHEGRWQWTEKELEKLLLQVLTHTSPKRRIVIFIDALDECEKDEPIKLLTCLKRFGEKIEQQKSYAKICFSSRHYPILGQAQVPTIVVENENREDIRRVTEERLKDIEPDEERQRIADVILSKDDGVFQWAVLVTDKAVKKYLKGFGVGGIEREIEKLPTELDSLYAGLLDEVNEDESERLQTIKLFRWVLFACRPLSVRELREALATDPHISYATVSELREHDEYAKPAEGFERRVIDMSKGLIQFNTRDVYESFGPEGSDRQVEFIHQSVPDYLLEYFLKPAESLGGNSHSSAGCGHFELSRSCLRYLTMYEIRDASKLLRVDISVRYPLVAYATRHFFTHVYRAEAEQVNQSDLSRLLHWDDETKKDMAQLWKTFDPLGSYTPMDWPFQGGSLVHILAALGSISAFKAMLCENEIEIDCKDSYNSTPLLTAMREGHHEIAQEILDRSAKWLYRHGKATETRASGVADVDSFSTSAKSYVVDVNTENHDLETPMTVAVSSGAPEVIFKLIEAGASLKNVEPASSPLLYSIQTNNKALLIELIRNGACLDGAVYYAVACAANMTDEHMEELIRILLEAGANTQSSLDLVYYATHEFYDSDDEDAVEIDSGSALVVSAETESLSILQVLLAHGPHTPDQIRAIWNVAMEKENLDILQHLLNYAYNASEGVRNDFARAVAGYHPLMEELLSSSSQTPIEVYYALRFAVDKVKLPVDGIFLIYKARITGAEPQMIHDVLKISVASGNKSMTRTILDYTVETKRSDSEVHDTFVAAVMSGEVSMAELLLDSPVMAKRLQPKHLYGALDTAVQSGQISMAGRFLNDPVMTTHAGLKDLCKDLFTAVKPDQVSMAKLLLNHPIIAKSLGPKDLGGALLVAIKSRELSMADLLVRHPIMAKDLGLNDLSGVLFDTVESGELPMADLLLSHPIMAKDLGPKDLGRALLTAVKSGELSMATLLLSHPIMANNLESKDLYGALLAAVVANDAPMVRLILRQSGMVSTLDPEKWDRAIEVAVQSDKPYMVELLSNSFIRLRLEIWDQKYSAAPSPLLQA